MEAKQNTYSVILDILTFLQIKVSERIWPEIHKS